MVNHLFGERWDAPIVDDAVQVETPVGGICYSCGEPIEAGDRGFVRAVVRYSKGDEAAGTVEPIHAECDLRSTMGHTVGVCPCTGYDADRASARLVWQRVGDMRGRALEVRSDAKDGAS